MGKPRSFSSVRYRCKLYVVLHINSNIQKLRDKTLLARLNRDQRYTWLQLYLRHPAPVVVFLS